MTLASYNLPQSHAPYIKQWVRDKELCNFSHGELDQSSILTNVDIHMGNVKEDKEKELASNVR